MLVSLIVCATGAFVVVVDETRPAADVIEDALAAAEAAATLAIVAAAVFVLL